MSSTGIKFTWALMCTSLALYISCQTQVSDSRQREGLDRLERRLEVDRSPRAVLQVKKDLQRLRFSTHAHELQASHARLLGDCFCHLSQPLMALDAYSKFPAHSGTAAEKQAVLAGRADSYARLENWRSSASNWQAYLAQASSAEEHNKAFAGLAQAAWALGDKSGARQFLGQHSSAAFRQTKLREWQPRRATKPAKMAAAGKASGPKNLGLAAGARTLRIESRQSWGARSIRPSGSPALMTKIQRITVHHSVTPPRPPMTRQAAIRGLRSIQKSHQDGRGWADLGYHYLIDGEGRIWEGRARKWQGAHAGNEHLNRGNLGICLMGNFELYQPTAAQLRALKSLLNWGCDKWQIPKRRVQGHHDVRVAGGLSGTLCPGTKLNTWLEHYRRQS